MSTVQSVLKPRTYAYTCPPVPQSAAGAGQFLKVNQTAGVAWTLPAGGTWTYGGAAITGAAAWYGWSCGIAAGGTTVGSAIAGISWYGCWEWETADALDFDHDEPIYPRADGSYVVIDADTGNPYHVLTHDQQAEIIDADKAKNPKKRRRYSRHDALYDDVVAHLAAHPELRAEEPAPAQPTEEELILSELFSLDAIVTRAAEDDLYQGKAPKYGPRSDALEKKQALRIQLAKVRKEKESANA